MSKTVATGQDPGRACPSARLSALVTVETATPANDAVRTRMNRAAERSPSASSRFHGDRHRCCVRARCGRLPFPPIFQQQTCTSDAAPLRFRIYPAQYIVRHTHLDHNGHCGHSVNPWAPEFPDT